MKTNCECKNWAGAIEFKFKTKGGIPIIPNHHVRCPHYNDSLIDVWKVTVGKISSYQENEQDAIDTVGTEDDGCPFEKPRITKEKMHREVFENLPEFEGF